MNKRKRKKNNEKYIRDAQQYFEAGRRDLGFFVRSYYKQIEDYSNQLRAHMYCTQHNLGDLSGLNAWLEN